MEVKINMLNVKDGDAIIIELSKSTKTLVMVIDGGEQEYYLTKMKPKLTSILETHNKKAPDVVVCTHYDSDHIGGLIPLIKDYIKDIKEVWVHKTPDLITAYIEKANQLKYNNGLEHIKSKDNFLIESLFQEVNESDKKKLLDDKAQMIIESLPQLKTLLELIPASKLKQVFHHQKLLSDWPEITVLGPTKAYYNTLFPKGKVFESFLKEEAMETLISEKKHARTFELMGLSPCDTLKKDSETSLTATNKASIIVAIDNEKKRYLFTGDAGIHSFKAIPNWQKELKDLYFLKIPHHASDNNISKELIEIMNPIYAYNTGFRHQDDAVLECLKSKKRIKEVKSTKTDGDLYFNK